MHFHAYSQSMYIPVCMCVNIIHTYILRIYHTCTHTCNYIHTVCTMTNCTERLTGIRSYDQIDSSDSDNGWLSCKLLPRNFEGDLLCNVAMLDSDTTVRLKIQIMKKKWATLRTFTKLLVLNKVQNLANVWT